MTSPDPNVQLGVLGATAAGIKPHGAATTAMQAGAVKNQIEGGRRQEEAATEGQSVVNRNESSAIQPADSPNQPQTKAASIDLNLSPSSQRRLEDTKEDMKQLQKEAEASDLARNTAQAVGAGVGIAGASAAIKGGVDAIKNYKEKKDTESTWDELQENHPDLANEETEDHFEVLQEYAPDLAKNPTVAKSYLQRAQKLNWTPHEFVQDLVGTQSDIDRGDRGVDVDRAMGTGAKISKTSSANDADPADQLERRLEDVDPRS
ncbi:MAG: hypothetical protein ABEN55_10895 [Bradymonadaceae bacterium]